MNVEKFENVINREVDYCKEQELFCKNLGDLDWSKYYKGRYEALLFALEWFYTFND